ncbi:AAA family ATPase [Mycoplasma buteonis]|uniref:AAA family ATPase n=1 Tax=Mycoplasma buteonis TaxID=171280 RepID=UPI00055BE133|nr:AAA family ATPase [Mycoplasma buteonis]
MINPEIINSLKKQIALKKNSHLYLLSAPNHYDFEAELLSLVNCFLNHEVKTFSQEILPNNLFLAGFNNDFTKDKLEEVFWKATFKNNNDLNVIIINQIEHFSIQSLNSILKSIEEPTENLVIIIATNNISHVLPTILSRAQKIIIKPLKSIEIYSQFIGNGILEPFALIASWIANDIFLAKKYVNDDYIQLFDKLCSAYIEMLKRKNNYYLYIFLVKHLEKDNEDLNLFLFKLIMLIHRSKWLFSNHNWDNKYLDRILKISQKLDEKNSNSILVIDKISDFLESIKNKGNFILQKEKLLIELMEVYEQ